MGFAAHAGDQQWVSHLPNASDDGRNGRRNAANDGRVLRTISDSICESISLIMHRLRWCSADGDMQWLQVERRYRSN